ncbi:hypothetical protein [Paenibacillus donghaensis]|nr:hypothetical protein [Paenibacillus donghaensis]
MSSYGLKAQYARKQVNEELSILNDNISEYNNGNLLVYEISKDVENVDNSNKIVEFLKSKNVNSGKVLIVNLEGRMNLEFYLPIGNQTAEILFTVEDLDGLARFVSQSP